MWKSLALMGIGFLVLLTVLVLISIGLAKRQSSAPQVNVFNTNSTFAGAWANKMIEEFPFEEAEIEGIRRLNRSIDAILIYGRYSYPSQYEGGTENYLSVKTKKGEFVARIVETTSYHAQDSIGFEQAVPTKISKEDIRLGDQVVMKTKLYDDFPVALEVRRLDLTVNQ